MLLWMILITWQITGAIGLTANGWLIVTVVCWMWHVTTKRK